MKRFSALLTAAVLLCTAVPAFPAAAETPAGLTWSFSDGTLVIAGEGDMPDYPLKQVSIKEGNTSDSFYAADAPWCDFRTEIRALRIDEGITSISEAAFLYCLSLENVVLPQSLRTIGDSAFMYCPSLAALNLPDSLAYIGNAAFERCTLLTIPSFPDSLETIGSAAFAGTSVEFPQKDGLSIVGSILMKADTSLRQVTVPASVRTVADAAFDSCAQLERVTLPDGLTRIGSFAFANCTALAEVVLPDGLSAIDYASFFGCTALTSLSMPDSVTDIMGEAFYGCTRFDPDTLSAGLRHVGLRAFEGTAAEKNHIDPYGNLIICNVLVSGNADAAAAVIPEGVTVIADEAFREHDRLVRVECPTSLRHIGMGAFRGCNRLATLQLNEGLCTVADGALTKCTMLTNLTVPASVTEIGAMDSFSPEQITGAPGTAAETLAAACGSAFQSVYDLPTPGKPIAFDPATDGWSFPNSSAVFGKTYYFTDRDLALVQSLVPPDSEVFREQWGGSCYGLALSALLVKNGVYSPAQLCTGAKSLADVRPTPEVLSFINYHHALQNASGTVSGATQAERLNRLINAVSDMERGASPSLLEYSMDIASHAVIVYGLEKGAWEWDGRVYDRRLLVWDPNAPDAAVDSGCLYYENASLDFCIPAYGVRYDMTGGTENRGSLRSSSNDIAAWSALRYPLPHDVNGDGICSVADAVALQRWLLQGKSPVGWRAADCNADGRVDARDLTLLKRALCVL